MKKYISTLLLLLAALIWGLSFSLQKSASAIPPFTLGLIRGAIAFLFLLALIPFSDKITHTSPTLSAKRYLGFTKKEIIGGTLSGALLCAAAALQQIGITIGADAGRAAFITSLYVAIVPILSLFLKRKSPTSTYIGVGIAIIGFYLLCIDGEFKIATADISVLGCAVVFAIHILVIERFSEDCNGIKMSCIQFGVLALLSLILAAALDPTPNTAQILSAAPELLLLGLGASGIAYTLQIIGQRGANPTVASITLSLESVFGVIGGVVFLNESLTVREIFGCITVFLALMLCEIDFGRIFDRKCK